MKISETSTIFGMVDGKDGIKMKRILFFFLLLMLFSTAYAEKARFAGRADYSSHLSLHIGETTLTCTGNYVKIKQNSDVVGHLEQADVFKLEDVSGSTARIKVLNSASTSPDSYNGLEGWVDIRFIDCGCSESEYYNYTPENESDGGAFDVEAECSNYNDLLDLYYEAYSNSRNHDDSFITSLYFEPMSTASGYCFIDLNDDGIDELLLTEEYGDPNSGDADGCIYEGYTLINGKPHRFIEGWTRKRNFLLDNGDIFEMGSDGAGFESYLIYRFNGLNLDFVEGYASSEYEEEGEIKGGMYRTLDGSYTTNPSLLVSDEEFSSWFSEVDKRQVIECINWGPFSEYPSHRN